METGFCAEACGDAETGFPAQACEDKLTRIKTTANKCDFKFFKGIRPFTKQDLTGERLVRARLPRHLKPSGSLWRHSVSLFDLWVANWECTADPVSSRNYSASSREIASDKPL